MELFVVKSVLPTLTERLAFAPAVASTVTFVIVPEISLVEIVYDVAGFFLDPIWYPLLPLPSQETVLDVTDPQFILNVQLTLLTAQLRLLEEMSPLAMAAV